MAVPAAAALGRKATGLTKIKNFRISLRPRDVAREWKQLRGAPLSPEEESRLEPALSRVKTLMKPASVYLTLTRQTAVSMLPLELPAKAVAISVAAVTIGGAMREALSSEFSGEEALLFAAIEKHAVEQASAFALRLIQDQSRGEECELLEPHHLQEAEVRQKACTMLQTPRVGIRPEGEPQPFERLWSVVWMPMARSNIRKSAKPRLEKALL